MADSAEDGLKRAFEEVLERFDVNLEVSSALEPEEVEGKGDYSEIIGKTQEKLDELNEYSEKLLQKTGLTREQLEAYVSNPNNFTQEQWETLQNFRKATDEFKRKTTTLAAEVGGESPKIKRGKKQEHRFGKKKHWIPL